MRIAALFAYAALAVASGDGVTPIGKVVQMLQEMITRAKAEMQGEAVAYAKYDTWAKDTLAHKAQLIEDAQHEISVLLLKIDAQSGKSDEAGACVQEQTDLQTKWEKDLSDAIRMDKLLHADWERTNQDYSESIYAIERAIDILKRLPQNFKGKALIQAQNELANLKVPKKAMKVINAFVGLRVEDDGDDDDLMNPTANAYEKQSGSIITMLQNLLESFMQEQKDAHMRETERRHAHQQASQTWTFDIENAKGQIQTCSEQKAEADRKMAEAKTDHTTLQNNMEDDEAYHGDIEHESTAKSEDYNARKDLRADELSALDQALVIIQSEEVNGNPTSTANFFVQLGNHKHDENERKQEVIMYLDAESKRIDSKVLNLLADKVKADPFQKVRKLIFDLITRLQDESNNEASHKGWCDKELKTNKLTRNNKAKELNRVHAQIDQTTAKVKKLQEHIAVLTKDLAENAEAKATAVELRAEEKTRNEEAIEDAKQGQEAVSQAMTILKDFYAKASSADNSQQYAKDFKGQQASGAGVLSMMEVIESDFVRVEQDTKVAEKRAEELHEQFLHETDVDNAAKETTKNHQEGELVESESELSTLKNEDQPALKADLDAANAYYDKLKPACVDTGSTFEERAARREQEIQALKEALEILENSGV